MLSQTTDKIKAKELNVRKGPSVDYVIVERVFQGDAYTIVEKDGSWGKLLSGIGWINISSEYVDIVE